MLYSVVKQEGKEHQDEAIYFKTRLTVLVCGIGLFAIPYLCMVSCNFKAHFQTFLSSII